MFDAPFWLPDRIRLANEILAQFRATAVARMEPGAVHSPGCDPGDEADLLESIFGEKS